MLNVLGYILGTIVLVFVVLTAYALLSRYVFNRVRVNKWIILAASIIALVLPIFIKMPILAQIAFSSIFVILILWFFDVNRNGYPTYKKEKKTVIKPKAKPNRVKNNTNKK